MRAFSFWFISQDLGKIANMLKEFFQGLEFIKLELRELDETSKGVYKKKFKEHKNHYQEILAATRNTTARNNRDALLDDAETKGVDDQETEENAIKEGQDLLASNKDALQNTLQTISRANELGTNTAEQLRQQNEQLGRIGDNLTEMDGMLKVSQKVIGQMARRMATDKYLWVIMGLAAAAILAVIIVSQTK